MGQWMSAALEAVSQQAARQASSGGGGLARLREAVQRDGMISTDEARHIIALHRSGEGPALGDGWDGFFLEALVEYFALDHEHSGGWGDGDLRPDWGRAARRALDGLAMDRLEDAAADARTPVTRVDEACAHALVDALGADGLVLSQLEIRLLERLFAYAVVYPVALRGFAWRALAATVKADGAVTEAETGLVRALVFGPASCEGIAVSRTEAAMLLAISAGAGAARPAQWDQLVAQAVVLHVLHGTGTPGTVDSAEQAWLDGELARVPSDLAGAVRTALARDMADSARAA
jgi:hypothetical protein